MFGRESEFSRGGLSVTLAAGHLCRVMGGRNKGHQGQVGISKSGANPAGGAGGGEAEFPEGAKGWIGEDGKIWGFTGGRAPAL